jgi:hypothetical protein
MPNGQPASIFPRMTTLPLDERAGAQLRMARGR